MKRNEFPQQQNEFPPKSLKNDNCTKICSTTTSKWTQFSQQQMHQIFLNNNNIKMDTILSTTNAPKFPQQQQHQNGQNSLNNKCTKISSTTANWTKFSQQ
jgi:hypothetical protein